MPEMTSEIFLINNRKGVDNLPKEDYNTYCNTDWNIYWSDEMEENYIYPARAKNVENGCQIEFLDFPEIVPIQESTIEKAICSAQESLALTILDYESEKKRLPIPSTDKTDIIYIHIWLPYFRNMAKEIYVKKNVTIPQWLDILAKENHVNYSAALVKGIKMQLGIKE